MFLAGTFAGESGFGSIRTFCTPKSTLHIEMVGRHEAPSAPGRLISSRIDKQSAPVA